MGAVFTRKASFARLCLSGSMDIPPLGQHFRNGQRTSNRPGLGMDGAGAHSCKWTAQGSMLRDMHRTLIGGWGVAGITSRRTVRAHSQGHSWGHICVEKSEYSPCAISTFVSGHDSKILTRFYLRVTGSGDCILFFTSSGEFIHKRLMFLNQRL